MNIYIDESGSINNKLKPKQDFVITLVVPNNKKNLECTYKRFISSNYKIIQIADVLSNIFYSELLTDNYSKEIKLLKDKDILSTL